MTDFSIIFCVERAKRTASGYTSVTRADICFKARKEQVNWWKVCVKVFPLIHFQMPAPNAEKNILTYDCVLDNLNSMGQNGSQATTRVLREWLVSSKRYKSEKCQLHWLYNLSKKTSNARYMVLKPDTRILWGGNEPFCTTVFWFKLRWTGL